MEDAELDLSEGLEAPETDADEQTPARKPFLIVPLIGLAFLAFAIFLVIKNNGSNSNLGSEPTEAFTSYQSLSNEVHTGIRLARLEDFVAQYPESVYSGAARARRDALLRHEEKAWAQLTDNFYHPEADEAAKALAISKYTDMWTPLLRPTQLKTLTQVLPDDAVPNFKPGQRRSRFASGGNDKFLEGGPIVRNPAPPPPRGLTRRDQPERRAVPGVIEPRIRGKARKPSYPRNARRRRVEANVVLSLDIDDKGRVRQIRVMSVDADRYAVDFAKAARRAARKTRFHPKTVRGRAVAKSGHIQKYAFRNNR